MVYKILLLKRAFLFSFTFLVVFLCRAQQADTSSIKKDSLFNSADSTVIKSDSALLLSDSLIVKKDSVLSALQAYHIFLDSLLKGNIYLHAEGPPVIMQSKPKKTWPATVFFYSIFFAVGMLAWCRYVYTRYFNNLFRVFFNTSLRQSQLTDQLLQARQASFFFNLLFIIIGGLYAYFLLQYFKWLPQNNVLMMMGICIISLAGIYIIKYITLKFTGWITEYQEEVNTYVFIVFLINKILSVLLVPFIIIIAFSDPVIKKAAVAVSLLLISLMFLLRFFRSFGLLQHKLKVSRFHFFLYIAGIEVLPLLFIYKTLLVLSAKNL